MRTARLELFISSGCNLHCGFCVESARIQQRTWMPWDEIELRLRQARSANIGLVQFMGGEATLHPRFPDALALCHRLGLRTYVITNLLRWEDEDFARAVAPHLDEIMISQHAHGAEAGHTVTGRADWWDRFQVACEHALTTLQARVKGSTVLTIHNVADLERIGHSLLRFRPVAWVMGAGVPVLDARWDILAHNLPLPDLFALRPRLEALSAEFRARGSRLIPFCLPHCAVGPRLWDDTHDQHVGDQDLGDDADGRTSSVHFWSRADYLPAPGTVRLGRSRAEPCKGCVRRDRCGGYFTDWFERHGAADLRPILS